MVIFENGANRSAGRNADSFCVFKCDWDCYFHSYEDTLPLSPPPPRRRSNHGDNKDMVRERPPPLKRARRTKSRTCGHTQKRKRAHKPSDRTVNQLGTDGGTHLMLIKYWARDTESWLPVIVIVRSVLALPSRSSQFEIRIMAPLICLKIAQRTIMPVIWPSTPSSLGPRHIAAQSVSR